MALEIVTFVIDIGKTVSGPVTEHSKYAFRCKSYVEELDAACTNLEGIRKAIQDWVDAAFRNAENIQPFVDNWIKDVDKALVDARQLRTEYDKETNAAAGRIPNLITRHSIGWKAKEQKVTIIDLNNNKDIAPLLSASNRTPLPVLVSSDDYMSFQSREKMLEDIMKALTDGNTELTIGVYGMGGMGKTTLAREVYRQIMKEKLFGMDVAMVTVTHKVDLKRIQEEMASMLGLKFDDGTIELGQRASLLQKRFENTLKGKGLIILDDLWEAVNLQKIGIPRDKGVKLLLTSRSHSVVAEMGSATVFHLDALAEVEARTLFETIVGKEAVLQDPERKSIATELVKKCQGFPIPIKALATTLKESSLSEWRDALKLNQSNDAYSNLELSYRYLKEDELKSLFLTCALFGAGNNIPVRELIRYSMGLGLFEGINSVKSARSRLHTLVKSLQESSLVLDSNGDNENVKMHDMVHETAIRIAAKEACALVAKSGSDLEKYPTQKLSQSTAISLPFGRIGNLPPRMTRIDFPELKILILIAEGESPQLLPAELLFQRMKELNVLHLSRVSFTSNLASSIGGLENLTTLCLDYCEWITEEEDIAIIGQLIRLQVLSFMGSPITYLAKEIGNLVELRLLDLRKCKYLTKIEPGVLRSLVQLEELYMENGFKHWEVDRVDEPGNAKLEELNELSELSILELHVPRTAMLPKDLPVITQLEEFRILIGDCWDWSSDKSKSRTLKLKADSRGTLLGKLVQAILDHTEDLCLDGLEGSLKKSINHLSVGGFHGVKRLHVQNSPLVLYVAQGSPLVPSFEKLEMLSLENLEKLEQICYGPPPKLPKSFNQLKLLRITKCRKLKSLFCVSLAIQGLPELEEIEISDCEVIEGIVQARDAVVDGNNLDDENKVKPCNLRRLKLQNLPEFVAFCTNIGDQTTARSFSVITSSSTMAVSALFDCQQVSFPLLEYLALSGLRKLKEIWSCRRHSIEFCHLKTLEVVDCGSLLLCIPYGALTSMSVLESLTIERCSSMQHVFDIGGLDSRTGGPYREILPHLEKIKLVDLPNLACIVTNSASTVPLIIFAKLKQVAVEKCNNLVNIFSSATSQHLLHLEAVKVEECEKVKAFIIADGDSTLHLPMLEYMKLGKLPVLDAFIHGAEDRIACPRMQMILIEECSKMKVFAKDVEQSIADEAVHQRGNATNPPVCFFSQKVSFLLLKTLFLRSMESLEKIWPDEIPNEEESFSRLSNLVIKGCKNLSSTLVPPTLVKMFQKLEYVSVGDCASVEVLFDFGCLENQNPPINCDTLMLPELFNLSLRGLVELKYIFKGNSQLDLPSLKRVSLTNCNKLNSLLSSATARTLSKLEELYIARCEGIQEVVSKEVDGHQEQVLVPISFPRLHSLTLMKLGSLKYFSSGGCVFDFPSLKDFHISECSSLKTFIQRPTLDDDDDQFNSTTQLRINSSSHTLFDDKVEFPNLDAMFLDDVGVQKIWNDELHYPSDSFSKLKTSTIGHCKYLGTIVPSIMLRRLQNLEKLQLDYCNEVEVIFQMEGLNQRDATAVINFDSQQVSFPQLESVYLLELGKLKEIWSPQLQYMEFTNLQILKVFDCASLSLGIPHGVVRSLKQLRQLVFMRCWSLQQVIDIGGLDSTGGNFEEILPQLNTLGLVDLPNLTCILANNAAVALTIFTQLTTVKVGKCDSLINIFSLTTTQRLPNLNFLSVEECKRVKAIIHIANDAGLWEGIDLPMLDLMNFKKLPVLATFICGSQDAACPKLVSIRIEECPKMKSFSAKHLELLIADDNNATKPRICFFSQKVYLPCLERLHIKSMESLEEIRLSEVPNEEESFSKLCYLNIIECKSLSTSVIPPSLVKKLQCLADVTVAFCASVEVVFDFGSLENQNPTPNEFEAFIIPALRSIVVRELPELKYMFKCNSRVHLDLPSLEKVTISNCKSIVYLFLNETARTLSKLNDLDIANCQSMRQVVISKEVDQQFLVPMSFLNLQSLILAELGNLECFSSGDCVFDFPSLESLYICKCSSLKTFIQRSRLDGDQFKSTSPSLFDDRVEFPNLGNMIIREVGMHEVWDSGLVYPSDSFSKLKSLEIGNFNNLVTLFPSNMLTRINNLEKLVIHDFIELNEIFQIQGLKQSKNDATGGNHFEKLKAGNSLDLPSLKEVKLIRCKSLTYLFPDSKPRTLSKLESIYIEECQSMQQIVSNDDDGQEQVVSVPISFPHLRSLKLNTVVSLKSFSSGDCLFEFPSLETLHMFKCSSLKTFIQRPALQDDPLNYIPLSLFDGKVEFPNLDDIFLYNLGMQKVWTDEQLPSDSFGKLKYLKIGECRNFDIIFPSNMLRRLQNLKKLNIQNCVVLKYIFQMEGLNQNDGTMLNEFDKLKNDNSLDLARLEQVILIGCKSLTYLFQDVTAKTLLKLEYVFISECDSMQEVVSKEAGNQEQVLVPMSFPNLRELELRKLSRLKCFTSGGSLFDFPSLKTLKLFKCTSLKTFIQGPAFDDDSLISSTHSLFDGKVEFPSLEDVELKYVGMQNIWNDEVSTLDSFSKLKSLVIEDCTNMVTIIPANVLHRLQNLQTLKIRMCTVLEVIVQNENFCHQNNATAGIEFEKGLPSLKEVSLSDCNNLIYLFNSETARSLSVLESIVIVKCESMQQVVSKVDGGEEQVAMSFPKLHVLKLSTLVRLKCFSQGGCMFDFPSLETLYIYKCTSLKTFIQRPGLDDDDELNSTTHLRVNSSNHSLFDDKVGFPSLDNMDLFGVDMQKIWNDELHYPWGSFCKLKSLQVVKCPNLVSIAPWNMVTRLQNLEKVEIYACIVLKEFFQIEEGWLNQSDSTAANSFEKLEQAYYFGCPALESSMPMSLLEKFREGTCDEV